MKPKTLLGKMLGPRTGATLSPWRPTLTASIDKSTIHLGESVTVTYQTENATSVMLGDENTFWGYFLGESTATAIPLNDSVAVTPPVGQHKIIIKAYRRNRDLNGDGKADGARRSVSAAFNVTVLP